MAVAAVRLARDSGTDACHSARPASGAPTATATDCDVEGVNAPVASHSTRYVVTGEPPSQGGARHVTSATPGTAVRASTRAGGQGGMRRGTTTVRATPALPATARPRPAAVTRTAKPLPVLAAASVAAVSGMAALVGSAALARRVTSANV